MVGIIKINHSNHPNSAVDKATSAKPDDLGLIPGTHRMKAENWSLNAPPLPCISTNSHSKAYQIFKIIYVHMCACLSTYTPGVSRRPQRPEEAIRVPELGVAGGYKRPDVGAGS